MPRGVRRRRRRRCRYIGVTNNATDHIKTRTRLESMSLLGRPLVQFLLVCVHLCSVSQVSQIFRSSTNAEHMLPKLLQCAVKSWSNRLHLQFSRPTHLVRGHGPVKYCVPYKSAASSLLCNTHCRISPRDTVTIFEQIDTTMTMLCISLNDTCRLCDRVTSMSVSDMSNIRA